jgi:putative ABC transport system substrate-binding protein
MRRRDFIAGTVATGTMGSAQPVYTTQTNARPTGIKRIAIFHSIEPPERLTINGHRRFKAYFDELNKLGYIEGQNLVVERYSGRGQPARFGELARQIIASRRDVLFPSSGLFVQKIIELNTDVPMVGLTVDPIEYGFTTTLARPDRNFTGVTVDGGFEFVRKRFQLLLEAAQKLKKVGSLLAYPTGSFGSNPITHSRYTPADLRRAGIAPAIVVVAGKIDRAAYERVYDTVIVGGEQIDQAAYERAFELMEKEGVDGLFVTEDHIAYFRLVADLAAKFRIAAIYLYRDFVEVGGLMAYGVNLMDVYRRVADMTGQVLRGSKPIDIPFYQQTKFELVLNQKAATSLGLEFPPTLLTAADDVIE